MITLKQALDKLAQGHELDNECKNLIIEMWQKELGQQPCEDCISRENAIGSIVRTYGKIRNPQAADYIGALKMLPSVQPTRIKAKWLKHEILEHDGYIDTMWECSICGQQEYTTEYKYCPNCGAKMDGGNENADR